MTSGCGPSSSESDSGSALCRPSLTDGDAEPLSNCKPPGRGRATADSAKDGDEVFFTVMGCCSGLLGASTHWTPFAEGMMTIFGGAGRPSKPPVEARGNTTRVTEAVGDITTIDELAGRLMLAIGDRSGTAPARRKPAMCEGDTIARICRVGSRGSGDEAPDGVGDGTSLELARDMAPSRRTPARANLESLT